MQLPALLALLALGLAAPVQDPPKPSPPPPPSRELVDATVTTLKKAFGGKELAPKLEAIDAARDVPDAKVVAALAKGMKEEAEVREATLDALRWMDHPDALDELHGLYRRDKKLGEDEKLFPLLLKAIAQHANPGSIEVLADDPFRHGGGPELEARILGLGRIRDVRAVEELIGMMQLVGPAKLAGRMDEFRMALMHLTGVDRGTSQEAWVAWWNENRKSLELPEGTPLLPEAMQRRWDSYWGEEHVRGRAKKREDRGGGE